MPVSSAAQNMFLGPVYVYYDGQELGKTKGGVSWSTGVTTSDMSSDQDGVIDRVVTDQVVTIKVPLAEVGFLQLAAVTGMTLQQKTYTTPISQMYYCIAGRSFVGQKASANAAELVLKKPAQGTLGTPSTSPNDWFTFPYAWPDGNIEISYSTEQTVYEATFLAIPDSLGIRFYVGDMRVFS